MEIEGSNYTMLLHGCFINDPIFATRVLTDWALTLSMGSFALGRGPSYPGLATMGLCKFYKVNSLAVATRISHNYQVLLDDVVMVIEL